MKTRRFLAALLAVMLLLSMIPLSASAAEKTATSEKEHFTLEYGTKTSDADEATTTVNLYDPEGQPYDTVTVYDARGSQQPYEIELVGEAKELYDIESISVTQGNVGSQTISSDSCTVFVGSVTDGYEAVINIYLAPQFVAPDIEGEEIKTPGTIEYRAFEPALLKLLKVNGVEVDENTEVTGVEAFFVEDYTWGDDDEEFGEINRGANTLPFFQMSLSDVTGGKGAPTNIRSLEISYTLNKDVEGAEEEIGSIKVYSGDLRYVNKSELDGVYPIYEIEANNDDTSIVAFYNEDDGQSTTWSLYDVTFVETGAPYLPEYVMPADPVYGDGSKYQFVNWDHSVGGGDPFLTYEPITDDTVLYAQKISSEWGGTEYHLMNPDNALMNRVLKLYNAGATTPVESIDPDTIKVQIKSIDGTTSTNKEYFTNDWNLSINDDRDYYKVYAGSAPGEPEPVTNAHVHPTEAASATIFFQIDGQEASVVIPIGNARPGDLGMSLVQDNIVELIVNPAPAAPGDDDMTGQEGDPEDIPSILGDGAVGVKCITGIEEYTNHTMGTYNILPNSEGETDSYLVHEDSVKTVINGDGTYGYTCEVTIYAGPYVNQYNSEIQTTDQNVTHTLADGEDESKTITLTWDTDENEWAPETDVPVVTFEVECQPTQGGDDEPEKPDDDDLKPGDPDGGLLGASVVTIDCVNEDPDATYPLLANTPDAEPKDSFTIGEVEKDETTGDYTCTITIYAEAYVEKYNDTYEGHTLVEGEDNASKTVTLTWDAEGGTDGTGAWEAPEMAKEQTAYVTFNVTCDGTGTDDPNKPDPPEEEDITGDDNIPSILGELPVQVECTRNGSGHDPLRCDVFINTPGADKDSFTIGDVEKDEDTNTYTCDITILPGRYVDAYNDATKKDHELTNEADEAGKVIELVWVVDDGAEDPATDGQWQVKTPATQEKAALVTFEVECEKPYSPPYVNPNPPADPDDTGVSDLLETDDHIQYLFGYPEGTFGPDRNMTRAEVAQMFYNLLVDKNVAITQVFTDVPADAWYAKAVNTLAALGVISGVGDGKFEPDRAINRAEFTTMAMKFAVGKTGGENMFSDVDENDWFYQAVVDSIQYGWITGYGDGTFRPYKLITRAEVTAIVNHMLGREADEDYVQLHQAELTPFTDLTSTHWGYYHIVEATNEHDYIHGSDPEDWTNLA